MVILKTDQRESIILDKDFHGYFQVSCDVFGEAVKLQFSDDNGDTWVDAYFNGVLIQLEKLGAILDQYLVCGRYYKFVTATPGSRVSLFKHDEAG